MVRGYFVPLCSLTNRSVLTADIKDSVDVEERESKSGGDDDVVLSKMMWKTVENEISCSEPRDSKSPNWRHTRDQ